MADGHPADLPARASSVVAGHHARFNLETRKNLRSLVAKVREVGTELQSVEQSVGALRHDCINTSADNSRLQKEKEELLCQISHMEQHAQLRTQDIVRREALAHQGFRADLHNVAEARRTAATVAAEIEHRRSTADDLLNQFRAKLDAVEAEAAAALIEAQDAETAAQKVCGKLAGLQDGFEAACASRGLLVAGLARLDGELQRRREGESNRVAKAVQKRLAKDRTNVESEARMHLRMRLRTSQFEQIQMQSALASPEVMASASIGAYLEPLVRGLALQNQSTAQKKNVGK